ncbi:unnamed protein product [Microthlaspi erraticum]|uniref:Classical arabinogalactan protein 25 n=1 Tax=Microthlaspi erraticum TaxID=1685480 RepID=A0A6D2L5H8_9BRAS|nr:unnamed protein product [Microthlaspi erraticum]
MASSPLNKLLIIIVFIFLSSPAFLSSLTSSPTISSLQQLSPEIAPLLPSPGKALPSDDGAGTIPSSPSPPDPDPSDDSSYPDPLAFAPLASPPVSSPAPPSYPSVGMLLLSIIISSASLRLRALVAALL